MKTTNNQIERISLRLPMQTKEKLEDEAQKRGVSVNSLICYILFNFFEEE